VLARTRFGAPRRFFVPGIPDPLPEGESVLSGAKRSPEGLFWDWPGDTEVVMALRPR
jgi:hypothetical protein